MSGIAILKLQRAGFTEQQVQALAEYHEAGAATKSDIGDLENKICRPRPQTRCGSLGSRGQDGLLCAPISRSRLSALDSKLDRTRSDLELATERVRHDLELKIAEGKAETIRWVVGVGFAQVAMILAVLRLFPSVHP